MTDGFNDNQTVASGLLTNGSVFYRLATDSPTMYTRVGTYSFLSKDILEGNRNGNIDAGAEEFVAGGTVGPYDVADVGITLVFNASSTLSVDDINLNKSGIKLFPVPANGELNILKINGAIGSIRVFNILEKSPHNQDIELNSATIDISNFSPSVHILETNGNIAVARFLVDFD